MRVEHIAFNVEDPAAMADWYCEHLGMKIAMQAGAAYFLSDETGHGILELYNNPPDEVPNYGSMHPLLLHVAFQSTDLEGDRARLIAAGATPTGPELPEGEQYGIVFVKDPWGFTVQFVRREKEILP